LSYLAEVASTSDPLPHGEAPVEDGFECGSIEDLLTAAAMAESLKDELCSSVGDEKDILVQGSAAERNTPDGTGVAVLQQNIAPLLEYRVEEQEGLNDESIPSLDHEIQVENIVDVPTVSLPYKEGDTVAVSADEHLTEPDKDDITDWGSLISFSEADEADPLDDAEQPHDTQILPVVSIRDASQELDTDEDLSVSVSHLPKITSTSLDGLDEAGHPANTDIRVFEDASEDDIREDPPSARQSLDGNVAIFSIPTEHTVVTSPPKRPMAPADEQNNVHPF
jgi:hypothetical protein